MNKKQWILSVIAAILFCIGLLLMFGVSVFFSDPEIPELTEPEQTTITEPTETETQPITEPVTEPVTQAITEPTVPETTAPIITVPEISEPTELGLTADKAFVYDTGSNTILYTGGDPNAHLAPASLTKILTAYTAVQFMDLDAIVTVGEEVTWIDPDSSIAQLLPGHQLSVKTLIYGLMLPSGNDAAYALAVAGGRVLAEDPELDRHDAFDLFINEMNEQSRRIGMTNSQFQNPDGIDAEGHYTTVNDLIILTKTVLSCDVIMEAASTATTEAVFHSGETVLWKNSNYLLRKDSDYYTPNAVGLKTGSTGNAGQCLISLFRQEDGSYLAIGVLGSKGNYARYDDTLILFNTYQ